MAILLQLGVARRGARLNISSAGRLAHAKGAVKGILRSHKEKAGNDPGLFQ